MLHRASAVFVFLCGFLYETLTCKDKESGSVRRQQYTRCTLHDAVDLERFAHLLSAAVAVGGGPFECPFSTAMPCYIRALHLGKWTLRLKGAGQVCSDFTVKHG